MDALEFCQSLLTQQPPPPNMIRRGVCSSFTPKDRTPPQIKREDLDALIDYVKLWTDIISVDDVSDQFSHSNFKSQSDFESVNHLTNVGFFYVQVNPQLSALEFFNLLSKIPWEHLKEPGLDQISYATIAQLFGRQTEQTAIQLMVLGSYCHFWELINPYLELTKTPEIARLFIAGNGTLTIYIAPNFLTHCRELIDIFNQSSGGATSLP